MRSRRRLQKGRQRRWVLGAVSFTVVAAIACSIITLSSTPGSVVALAEGDKLGYSPKNWDEDGTEQRAPVFPRNSGQQEAARRTSRRALRRPCPQGAHMYKLRHRNICICDEDAACSGPACQQTRISEYGRSRMAHGFPADCAECLCYAPSRAQTPPPLVGVKASRFARKLRRPLVMWRPAGNHTDVRPTCYTPAVCVRDGHLHFPPLSRRQIRELRRCGITVDTTRHSLTSYTLSTSPVVDFTDTTLLGWRRARNWHFPHFMLDAVWLLHAYPVLAGPHDAAAAALNKLCLAFPSSSMSRKCPPVSFSNTSLLVEVERSDNWSSSFTKLLTDGTATFCELPQRWVPDTFYCFDGVLSANVPFHQLSRPVMDAPYGFFAAHNIIRTPVGRSARGRCERRITVLIVNRGPDQGRHLANIHDVMTEVALYMYDHGVYLQVREEDMNNKTMEAQIRLFNGADVVVSAHGAANTNFLFLRPGALAVEVFPFGYHPKQYGVLAGVMGAHHVGVTADPDTISFVACMHRSSSPALIETTEAVVRAWVDAEYVFRSTGKETLDLLQKSNAFPDHPIVRPCVRQQPLRVSVGVIARAVREWCQGDDRR